MRTVLILLVCLCTASFAQAADSADLRVLRSRLCDATLQDGRADTNARLAATMRDDGSWADIDYADKTPSYWKPSNHLYRLVAMAKAYRGGKAANLKPSILRGFDYWTNLDPRCPNWWHNQIGAPLAMGNLLILMGNDLSARQIAAGVRILNRATWKTWTGQNLVWGVTIQIVRGCVENSEPIVAEAYQRLYDEIRIAPLGQEGIQADFSFHQHGPLLYSGGYGLGFTTDCVRFIDLAKGTRFAPPPQKLRILESYILDGQRWMTRGGIFDYSATGRELTRPGKSAGPLAATAGKLAVIGERRDELLHYARLLQNDPAAKPLTGNRHFWRSDYMAHHRPTWFASVRMHSDRLLNTDGYINGENKQSHHLADGVTMLYLTGREYADIFPLWDWHRLPGITAPQGTKLIPNQVCFKGGTSFVGGVSNGTYGLAAMHVSRSGLDARKAWFFYDDEYLCLGSGITSASGNPINTTIEQCLARGETTTGRFSPAGKPQTQWLRHGNTAYILPADALIKTAVERRKANWNTIGASSAIEEQAIFSLWLDHSADCKDAHYQYIVVPSMPDDTGLDAIQSRIHILANTPAIQAAWHDQLKLLGIVFAKPGQVKTPAGWSISAYQPCLLLLQHHSDRIELSVSDPEGGQPHIDVETNLPVIPNDKDILGVDATMFRIRIPLPTGLDAGRTVTRSLRLGRL